MQLRLTTKFTLVTSAVLISAMLLFAYFSIRSLEETSIAEAVKDIDNLSETILRTTFHQMLEDDRARVYQTIAEVGFQRGVRHIRLINKDGLISFSTRPEEVGLQVDKGEPSCNMCHGPVAVEPLLAASSMSRSRRFVDEQGETVMGMARAIYNQPSCSTAACHEHPAGDQLLGVLDITVSLAEMTASTAGFRERMILATLGLLFTLGASLAVVIRRFIHRPVRDLLAHTRRLAQGDLEGRIERLAKDELGELEEAFNEMTGNLRRVQGELRELAASLESKVEERTRQVQDIQKRLVRSEKLASLGELVAGIAHEINNPLTGIMVFSSLTLENHSLPQALRDDLSVIYRETQRCSGIVRRLLEFSREAPPDKTTASINHLLDHTLRLLENQATFQNICITRNYTALLPQLHVDANQISQVFMNILLNAAQAMPDGGTLMLETVLAGTGGEVLVRVRDSGCGIAEQDLKRIFDPFFTTKKESGTGLGLSVSYGIVENHGGTIDVESSLGAGTTFTITLPVDAPEAVFRARADTPGVMALPESRGPLPA
ncbi:sensor histidine kinase, HAMP domain-containing protein [Desulfuromonas sp. DDH964]|uniref:sensor histidine kinase n=1 Tax=Desulfuromonas sp. DDH964 TaxID=1823759 RepID=UPI00078C67E3|nr:ATP-binding protein [Desulfuromonas sp. DDH964]AMV72908.1 sensor histidine kinase, HAMP domain-containing protein [Desulfuromonas sp. DDH964]